MIRSIPYLLLLAILLCFPFRAQAQQNYYNADEQPVADSKEATDNAAPAAHNVVVTSIEKCYAQLNHAEVLDIETNYVKPYEECQKRLARKIKNQHQAKVTPDKDAAPAKDAKDKDAKDKDAKDKDSAAAGDAAVPADSPADSSDGAAAPEDAGGGFFRVQKSPSLPSADGKKPNNAGNPYGNLNQ